MNRLLALLLLASLAATAAPKTDDAPAPAASDASATAPTASDAPAAGPSTGEPSATAPTAPAANPDNPQIPDHVQRYIEKKFQRDDQEGRCHGLEAPAYQGTGDKIPFCMQLHSLKHTDRGSYALFIGNSSEKGHGNPGLVRLVAFDRNGQPGTEGDIYAGSWGEVPTDWRWTELGPEVWGVADESGYSQMGETYISTQLIFDMHGQVQSASIASRFSNRDKYGDCSNAKELAVTPDQCARELADLTGELKVKKDLPQDFTLYPVAMVVSGSRGAGIGEEKFDKREYIFHFDGKNYRAPADYPIKW